MRRSAAPALRLVPNDDGAGAPEADYLDAVFRPGDGLIAAARPGYERRDGQVRLARAVDRAFRDGTPVLAEAETGTGKSFAALVPATYHAATHGKRVAYVTSSIVLQEQVVTKDLPFLQSVLPWRFTYALAKGIGNYACKSAVDDAVADAAMGQVRWNDRDEAAQWAAIQPWLAATATGDLSELSFDLKPAVRLRVTTTAEECTGKACPRFDGCHGKEAAKAYGRAQVVVTNYHLFFADLAVRVATGGEAGILPAFDLVVFDEGDRAPAIACDFFGFRVTSGTVRHAVRHLAASGRTKVPMPSVDPALRQEVADEAEAWFSRLLRHRRSPAYRARVRRPGEVPDPTRLVGMLRQAADKMVRAGEGDVEPAAGAKLRLAATRCRMVAGWLGAAHRLDDRETVVFVDDDRDRAALVGRLISAAPVLAEHVFNGARGVAAMSATLTVAGSFAHARASLGADDAGAAEVRVESPFDFRKNALLVVPRDMPEPNDPRYPAAMTAALVDAVRAARGRTLALFTSNKNLKLAHEALLAADLPFRVMRQGEAPRTALIDAFKADESSVLLGVDSFWTGVDVPGPALSLLVVDKVPFPPPDDPTLSALEERVGKAVFHEHSVPLAVTKLRQGVGRLIRSATDRGAVLILDSRLRTKPYGARFMRALPPMRVGADVGAIGEFFAEVTGG